MFLAFLFLVVSYFYVFNTSHSYRNYLTNASSVFLEKFTYCWGVETIELYIWRKRSKKERKREKAREWKLEIFHLLLYSLDASNIQSLANWEPGASTLSGSSTYLTEIWVLAQSLIARFTLRWIRGTAAETGTWKLNSTSQEKLWTYQECCIHLHQLAGMLLFWCCSPTRRMYEA